MEDTILKIFFGFVVFLAMIVVIGIFLVIIKILFIFFPEINLMGIHMTPNLQ